HHPETLHPHRGRDENLRRRQLVGQLDLREEPEHVDAVVRAAHSRLEEADGERIGADDAQARARLPPDLGPGPEQHAKTLAGVVAADEDDAVLAGTRLCMWRDEDSAWHE